MKPLSDIFIDISVVLGNATMPIHQLLRMGRGAIIEIDAAENDTVTILANETPIARARIIMQNERISVEVVEMLTRADIVN